MSGSLRMSTKHLDVWDTVGSMSTVGSMGFTLRKLNPFSDILMFVASFAGLPED